MIKPLSHRYPFGPKVLWLVLLLLTLASHGILDAKPAPVAPAPLPAPPLPQPDYFFNLDLDPCYQFVGKGAVTEDEAATTNCYHFIYNDAGKLKQIEYRRAGNLMPDPLLGVASIDFEYQPGIERRWYHDAQGNAR